MQRPVWWTRGDPHAPRHHRPGGAGPPAGPECGVHRGLWWTPASPLNSAAEARSTVAEAHIQVDTGLGFGGFLAGEPEKIVNIYRNLPNVAPLGHLYPGPLHPRRRAQRRRAAQAVPPGGGGYTRPALRPGSSTPPAPTPLMHYDFARMDAVRAGSVPAGPLPPPAGRRPAPGWATARPALRETRWVPWDQHRGQRVHRPVSTAPPGSP